MINDEECSRLLPFPFSHAQAVLFDGSWVGVCECVLSCVGVCVCVFNSITHPVSHGNQMCMH